MNIENPVYFVGAGPGDIDLITIKGRQLLDEADCIIYAGSLVNKALIADCKADIFDSATMDLDQIEELIVKRWQQGEKIVRLHTGDPAIFGAIREQMQRLRQHHIPSKIVPGVTAATGAAAALGAELTLPELSQTVILTRIEGRTPVPCAEKLEKLAAHQATMMIFLSVSMIDKVVAELVAGGYAKDTPVAVVAKATWNDEKIVRGTLEDIAAKVQEAKIVKTALICVGRVFDHEMLSAESKLYNSKFSHGTRQARQPEPNGCHPENKTLDKKK